MPRQLTPFVGRSSEKAEILNWLRTTPLVSLVGPGGAGKTRLAIELGAAATAWFTDGVWFVELAAITEPERVADAVATALGAPELARRSALATLVEALASRRLLIILDNCEHVIDAGAELVDAVLRECPNVSILATSRERLGVIGELVWPVAPLTTPDPDGLEMTPTDLAAWIHQHDSVQLFIERATAARPSFQLTVENAAAVAQICRRLDGIPLAIELAAARVAAMSPQQLAARLDQRFRLLVSGSRVALPRQRTLQALVDWSYDRLSAVERSLFRRLAVFSDGWTLDAAEQVCGDDCFETMFALVDKSLIVAAPAEVARYRYLETIRAYALARLDGGDDRAETSRRHFEWCLALARAESARFFGADEAGACQRLNGEIGNLRAAIAWARAQPDGMESALELVGVLNRLWDLGGHLREGLTLLAALLPVTSAPTRARVDALLQAANLSLQLGAGTFEQGLGWLDAAISVGQTIDYCFGVVMGLARKGATLAHQGDLEAAETVLDQAIAVADAASDPRGRAYARYWRGEIARQRGDVARAREWLDSAMTLLRTIGQTWGIGLAANSLARVELLSADYDRAVSLSREALACFQGQAGWLGASRAIETLGWLAGAHGDATVGCRLLGASAALRQRLGAQALFATTEFHDKAVDRLRSRLGDARFEAEWANGSRLTIAQATALASSGSADRPLTPTDQNRHANGAIGSPLAGEARRGPTVDSAERLARGGSRLSDRESEVADLITEGLTNQQIADRLVISRKTAAHHVQNILGKLDFTSRAQIAAWRAKPLTGAMPRAGHR